jgi:hypothetical protein
MWRSRCAAHLDVSRPPVQRLQYAARDAMYSGSTPMRWANEPRTPRTASLPFKLTRRCVFSGEGQHPRRPCVGCLFGRRGRRPSLFRLPIARSFLGRAGILAGRVLVVFSDAEDGVPPSSAYPSLGPFWGGPASSPAVLCLPRHRRRGRRPSHFRLPIARSFLGRAGVLAGRIVFATPQTPRTASLPLQDKTVTS